MIRTSDSEGTYWSSDSERTQGFRAAMADAGLPVEPGLRRGRALRDRLRQARHAPAAGPRDRRPPPCSPTPTSSRSGRCAPCRRRHQRARPDLAGRGRRPPHRASCSGSPASTRPSPPRAGWPASWCSTCSAGRRPAPRAISAEFRLEVRSTTGPPPATSRATATSTSTGGGPGPALSARASSHSGQEGAVWRGAKVRSPH